MDFKSRFRTIASSYILPIATAATAIAIFALDTLTNVEVAVPVLYIPVIPMAARFLRARGIVLVSLGCAALTALGYFLSSGDLWTSSALLDRFLALLALGMTTLLVLKSRSAEAALREQAHLLDLTHDTVFVRDANDVITYWNRGAEELYGWKSEEAVGKVTHQLLHTIFPAPHEEIREKLFRTGRWEGELVHTKRDGTKVFVASRWSAERDEQGRPVGTLETNNDITARKHAQESLQQAQMQLAHVSRVTTLGELTASIAHEVNQPLTAVCANAAAALRWLAAQPPNMEEARQTLSGIVADGRRASEIIKRIRGLVKKAPQQIEQFDINQTIREVIDLTRGEMQKTGVSLQTQLVADLPPVSGDRIQLQQVILNLIINAIEAMSGASGERRDLLIGTEKNGSNEVLVVVRDSGPGLDAESFDRLFDAFYTTKPDGIGMGLAISRSIIAGHGGRLWVTSNVPHGAIFQFTLPPDQETAS